MILDIQNGPIYTIVTVTGSTIIGAVDMIGIFTKSIDDCRIGMACSTSFWRRFKNSTNVASGTRHILMGIGESEPGRKMIETGIFSGRCRN